MKKKSYDEMNYAELDAELTELARQQRTPDPLKKQTLKPVEPIPIQARKRRVWASLQTGSKGNGPRTSSKRAERRLAQTIKRWERGESQG